MASQLIGTTAEPDHIITFFIKEYSYFNVIPEKITQKILTPGKLEYKITTNKLNLNSATDFYVAYAGYLAKANHNGQVILPRKTTQSEFTILITDFMEPVLAQSNNVAYWQLTPQANVASFRLKLGTDHCWQIKKKELDPEKPIPLQAIIIIAKPKNIEIKAECMPISNSSQLLLPTIYVKKDIDHVKNALFILAIRKFFAPIKKIYRPTSYGFSTQITT